MMRRREFIAARRSAAAWPLGRARSRQSRLTAIGDTLGFGHAYSPQAQWVAGICSAAARTRLDRRTQCLDRVSMGGGRGDRYPKSQPSLSD